MALPAEKKPAGMVISLGLGKKKPEAEDESMDMSAKEEAAQDMIDALNGGDAAGVASAFKTMYDLCAAEHGDSAEEEMGEEY